MKISTLIVSLQQRLRLLVSCLLLIPVAVTAQGLKEHVDFLLESRPHYPNWRDYLKERMKSGKPLPPVPPKTDPGEDADADQLLAFWEQHGAQKDGAVPSPAVLDRLAIVLKAQPERLPAVLRNVPAHDGLIELAEIWMNESAVRFPESRSAVRNWLFSATGQFQDEIEAAARDLQDTDRSLQGETELELLLDRDRPAAESILKELTAGDPRSIAPIARTYLFQLNPDDASLREQLIEDSRLDLKFGAQYRLFDVLLGLEWDDPKEWFASVLASPNNLTEWWIGERLREDPGPWVDVLDQLLDHKNQRVRQRAAALIVEYFDRHPKPELDTLRKLLPWLEDENWLVSQNRAREEFILTLRAVDLPEAVPGALHLLRTEKSDVAAEILAAQNYREALPELKAMVNSGELVW